MASNSSQEGEVGVRRKPNFTRLVAALTGANALLAFSSLITGPLQARSLGPTGRGDLAAILVPITLVPTLLDLGLTAFMVRARARGESRANLLGSLVPISFGFSLIGVAAAVPIAHLIGHGRDTVETCLMVGLFLSPLWVIMLTAQGLPWGEERWRSATFVRIAGPVITAPAMVVLYLRDTLTVETAFGVFLAASILANAPLIVLMARSGRWRFKRRIVQEGTHFGVRAWTGNLFNSANARLDQVLMAGLVAPRQLGLYVVAVSVASFSGSFVLAVSTAINPRVAQGNTDLAKQSSRVGLLVTTIATVSVAVLVPFALPLLFGTGFEESVLLTWVLLVAAMANSVSATLLSALAAAGHPGAAARAQLIVLAPTIIALVLLLPSTGALGAAVITSVSGIFKTVALLREAVTLLGGRWRDYLVVHRVDLQKIRLAVRRRKAVAG